LPTRTERSSSTRQARVRREILKEAAEVDAAEDELFGDARGDELPPEFRSTGELRKRLREAKQRLDAKRAAEQKPVPRSRPERLREAKKRLEQELELERRVRADYRAWRARGISADGRRFGGREPRLEPLPEQPRGKIKTTDSGLAQRQDAAQLHAGLQRAGDREREPDRARRRGDRQLAGLRTAAADGRGHQEGTRRSA
jgi:hypothetical protein